MPDKIDIACALVTVLVLKAYTPEHFERLLHYSDKLQNEAAVVLGKLLVSKDKDLVLSCPAWADWSQKYYDMMGS